MRCSGRRKPRSLDEASRRLDAIDRAIDGILRDFPELSRPPRGEAVASREAAAPRHPGRGFQVRGVRVH